MWNARSIPTLALAAILWAAPTAARADYVVASRHALVKADSARDADTLLEIERGVGLGLLSGEQSDGYYHVGLSDGRDGWVYRTFVRRYPGSITEVGSSTSSGAASPAPASTASATTFAYRCEPVCVGTEYPVKVLRKPFFTIGYSEDRKNPLWVCYAIGPAQDLVAYKRKRFGTDKDTSAQVSHDDYTGALYSRGHMAPRFAISSRYSKAGNDATFIMSNVCPQFQSYNDGQWGDLEEWVAGKKQGGQFVPGWADQYEKVWVTVGPIFDRDRTPLPKDIEVPNAFYCIVVDEEGGKPRALGFVLEHEDKREGDLTKAIRSIREIEGRTGLDFFRCLPDDEENELEASRAGALWPLNDSPN